MALPKLKKIEGVIAVWKSVLGMIASEPKILLPFAVLGAIETISLYILSCSPHFPFNFVLGPPIRRIWGEGYLHYPYFYELLPKMFYYAKIVLGIFVGSLASGMAVYGVFSLKNKETLDFKKIFKKVWKRYLSLCLLAVILYAAVHFLMKQPMSLLINFFRVHPKLLFLGPKFWLAYFMPVFNFILAIILQGLFAYAIPYVVITGKKFVPALLLGIRLFFRLIVKTILVVALPMCIYIPITMLRDNLGFISNAFFPEAVGFVLFLGILVGTVVIDSFITIATTLIFIEATHEK